MKNKGLILLAVLAAAGGAYYYYGTEPSFSIESYDHLTKRGVFVFSGNRNSFGDKGGNATGRGGYSVNYTPQADGNTVFKLFKNGVFVRELKPYQLQ